MSINIIKQFTHLIHPT